MPLESKINPLDLLKDSDQDAELTVAITSKGPEGRRRDISKDDWVENQLTYIKDCYNSIKEETGFYPNMVGLDSGNFSLWAENKRIRDLLREHVKEVRVLPRWGRSILGLYHMDATSDWEFPLPRETRKFGFNLPFYAEDQGSFAAIRKHDIHTGIDLYCEPGTPVTAVEYGEVINIENFTGPKAGSEWWHDTQAVWVKGPSGVVVYGEIEPKVKIGQKLHSGDLIGHVLKVLKKDKGKPMTMLHLEVYAEGMTETVVWKLNDPQPKFLKDPTPYMMRALAIRLPNSYNYITESE